MNIHFETYGDGPQTVVISPGLTQTCANWRTICRQNPEFHWVCFDPRGQGKSPVGERPYHIDDHVQDLISVLDQAELRGKPILMGFSHGGRVAIRAMQEHQSRFEKLILVSTAATAGPWRKATIRSWYECLKLGGIEALAWCSLPTIVGPTILRKFAEPDFLIKGTVHRNNKEGLEAMFEGMLSYPVVVEELGAIEIPVLTVRGALDMLVREEDDETYLEKIPHVKIRVQQESGHTVALEDTVWFLEQVTEFMKENA